MNSTYDLASRRNSRGDSQLGAGRSWMCWRYRGGAALA